MKTESADGAAAASLNLAAGTASTSDSSGRFNQVLASGIAALLVLGSLAFGAVQSWAIFVLQCASMLLLLIWAVGQAVSGRLIVRPNALFVPMFAFACLLGAQILFGLSAYAHATVTEGLKYVAYGALFFLTVQCFSHGQSLRQLAAVLVVFGFCLAVFAVVQDLTWNGKIYWFQELRFGSTVYGPYVNRNHYAGLMEMLTAFPLVLSLNSSFLPAKRALLAFAAIVMAGTIFLSGSRGGMIAFAIQVVFLALWLSARRSIRSLALSFVILLVLTVVLLLWLGGDKVADRLATLRDPLNAETSGNRLTIARDSWNMIAQRPVAGWGLGVFPIAYPQYRSFFTTRFVNQAHNDYLQLLVENGALGLATGAWFLILLYRNGFRQLRRSRLSRAASSQLAALAGCTGIVVHSVSDFNLHIPANAVMFFVLCAVATNPVETDADGDRQVEGRKIR